MVHHALLVPRWFRGRCAPPDGPRTANPPPAVALRIWVRRFAAHRFAVQPIAARRIAVHPIGVRRFAVRRPGVRRFRVRRIGFHLVDFRRIGSCLVGHHWIALRAARVGRPAFS